MKKIGTLFLGLLIIISLALGVLTFMGYNEYRSALAAQDLQEKIDEIQNQPNYTSINDISPIYLDAVIAVEDHDFYHHKGIDIESIGRAVLTNLKEGALIEGGSTITQQLAKNLYFSQEKDFVRKIAELFMTFKMEKTYSKDEILEFYVNSIYFGEGYYGIGEASQGYFGISPAALNDEQSIVLAGIPNAPSVYSLSNNPDLAKQRAYQVLGQMVKYDFIDKYRINELQSKIDEIS
ncbi:transglycosylase domain-containing protein [uncultured Faecalicoccus sp.]|uniref:transglycosylase domain-containing protein n=1 Tax=uncultured Faecalicoccus sp. TaxID=1971760 RepID=UPI0025EE9CFF|nr:biosynthetic peptidoglycan transglycosylase [uncultured Faecalicoccus sp.]